MNYESDSLGIISLFSANVSEASFNIKVEQIQHKGSRLGSRSYRVRGYKQGHGWEAIPTGFAVINRVTAGKPFLQGSRL